MTPNIMRKKLQNRLVYKQRHDVTYQGAILPERQGIVHQFSNKYLFLYDNDQKKWQLILRTSSLS